MTQSATSADKAADRRRLSLLHGLALTLLTLALALPVGASASVAASSGWFTQSTGSAATLTGLAFGDATHGWAVGYDPGSGKAVILATKNAGATWSAQNPGSAEDLNDVAFIDAARGWAVGTGGIILATTNGGASWFEQRPAVPVGSASYSQDLNAVAISDADRGAAVGADGIVTTTNGGATWSEPQWRDASFNGVAFGDAMHGWAVGNANGEGLILVTSDGGATWSPQSSPSIEDLHGVTFINASQGCAVGDFGTILTTANGGDTWTLRTSGTTEWLDAVAFGDATHGWAVGQDGTILATSNGGATWAAQDSGLVIQWLRDVAFIDASHGWVAGGYYDKPSHTWGGVILATKNGGGGAPTPGDTVGPVCAAQNARVKRGKTCKIFFKVYDALSAQVTTVLAITTKSGAVKRSWSWDFDKSIDAWWSVKYTCRLPRGIYNIRVGGKDLAGNPQSVVGKATLTVK
jgi:photosystem II stability/assembly factor-like uncharacterized protein